MRVPVLLVSVAALTVSAAHADTQLRERTLVELAGVDVLVAQTSADAESAGITQAWAETFLEDTLRLSGIRVLDLDERLREPGFPYLFLNVTVTRVGEHPLFAYFVRLDLHQTVLLDRDRKIHAPAPTWSATAKLGYAGTLHAESAIKETVSELAEEFIRAYRAAHAGGDG